MREHAADLFATTLDWTVPWFDPAEAMVWNPPGSFGEPLEARRVHLTPNTAWFAYGALASGRDDLADAGRAALRRLVSLQYDAPGQPWDGTFVRYLETPEPRPGARMWHHFDPNWRQFVGTTFALVLEDLADRLDPALVAALEHAVGRCVAGEPDGRIAPSYTNPALMRAWLDAWYGRRHGDESLVARGERLGRQVVHLFDRHDAFDEFNSPTYYGIDLLALRLWQTFPPSAFFAEQGARLDAAVWRSAAQFFNPGLGTFAGPFTRAYDPDARRAVTLMSLWVWADQGRALAPLPDLDTELVDHGHDLMAGPVIARLAAPGPCFTPSLEPTRRIEVRLATDRAIATEIHPDYSLGVESSPNDWGGWNQFMPVVFQWRDAAGVVASCWLTDPGVVGATLPPHAVSDLAAAVDLAPGDGPVTLLTNADVSVEGAGRLRLGGRATLTATDDAGPVEVAVTPDRGGVRRLALSPRTSEGPRGPIRLGFRIGQTAQP